MARNAEVQLTDPSKVMPNGGFKLIGSYEKVAAMLDQFGSTPGIKGIMLIFDDFIAA